MTVDPLRIAHYELFKSIGRDGASEIYRARDLRLEREVAVKLLRREQITDPAAVDLFEREAHLASLVTHPHICAVHDSGKDNGQPYLVLEFLDGRALDEVIADTPLPVDRALDICMQIADALGAAHRRDIVHGNLKPSNVFITTDGHVKLLELGAARAATPATAAVTRTDGASRTTSMQVPRVAPAPVAEFFHAYLAPEQIAGLGADPRADIFATGALLYEMITGRRAFRGEHSFRSQSCYRSARTNRTACCKPASSGRRGGGRGSSARKRPVEALPVGCAAAGGTARRATGPSPAAADCSRKAFLAPGCDVSRGWRRCADCSRRAGSRRQRRRLVAGRWP